MTCARRSGSTRWSRASRSSWSTTCSWSRSAAVIFWGTFFPLISELFTGNKASLAAPWFDRYTTPLAILLVLFTGIGPLLAWRRVSWASAQARLPRAQIVAAALAAVALALFTDAAHKPWALALFVLRRLRARRPRAGVLAAGPRRGASSPAARSRPPWSRSSPATGAATAATSSTSGSPSLLIGIAASSSFQTNHEVTLRPGQSTALDGRKVTYVRADRVGQHGGDHARRRTAGKAGRHRSSPSTPTRRYFRPTGVPASAQSAATSTAKPTAGSALKAGLRSDFWIRGGTRHHRRQAAGAGGRSGL